MKKEEKKELQEEFIKKRVIEGKSFDTISKELGVAKGTLIKWAKELENEISQLENEEKDRLLEEYKVSKLARLERILKLREKIFREIEERDLKDISSIKLFELLLKLELILNDNLDLVFDTGEVETYDPLLEIEENLSKPLTRKKLVRLRNELYGIEGSK